MTRPVPASPAAWTEASSGSTSTPVPATPGRMTTSVPSIRSLALTGPGGQRPELVVDLAPLGRESLEHGLDLLVEGERGDERAEAREHGAAPGLVGALLGRGDVEGERRAGADHQHFLAHRDADGLGQPGAELGLELCLRVGVGEPADVDAGDRDARQHRVAQRVRAREERGSGDHDEERGDERHGSGAAAATAAGCTCWTGDDLGHEPSRVAGNAVTIIRPRGLLEPAPRAALGRRAPRPEGAGSARRGARSPARQGGGPGRPGARARGREGGLPGRRPGGAHRPRAGGAPPPRPAPRPQRHRGRRAHEPRPGSARRGRARARPARSARGYSNLEYDLESGSRGSRQDHLAAVLRELTGAEAAIVVNNNAAAVLLALAALAEGREVIVSRGELIEIGDGFRIPDVLTRSGATLVEVGTTNRTRLADFEHALTDRTAALLRVHQSNFRMVGFTEQPRASELAKLAERHGLALVDDLGSGALVETGDEPTVAAALEDGAHVVTFSGDKLLGGPQVGNRRRARRPDRAHAPPSAAARAPRRQADAGGARGHAGPVPRRQPRPARPADARRAGRGRASTGRAARRAHGRHGGGDDRAPRRRLAPAHRDRELGLRAPAGARRAAAPRASRPWSASCATTGSCSTAARSPTPRSRRPRRPSPGAADRRHRRPRRPREDLARRALTGKDTDRLPEEQRRGISIDLGYAPLELPDGRRLSLVDVPGHERFVRTMVAGAIGDRPLPPRRRRRRGRPTADRRSTSRSSSCSGSSTASSPSRRSTPSTRSPASWRCAEARELVPRAAVVATSAVTGEGLDELRAALAEAADRVEQRPSTGPARLFVDRVFTLRGIGTVVTGTLWSGSVGEGDSLRAEPAGLDVRVRSVQVHDRPVERAEAGQRVAVALPGVERTQLRRGDALVEPGAYPLSYRLDVALAPLAEIADGVAPPRPPRHRRARRPRRSHRRRPRAAPAGLAGGRRPRRPGRPARGDDARRRHRPRPGAAPADVGRAPRPARARRPRLDRAGRALGGRRAAAARQDLAARALLSPEELDAGLAAAVRAGDWYLRRSSSRSSATASSAPSTSGRRASALDPGIPVAELLPQRPWAAALLPLLPVERRGAMAYAPGATAGLGDRADGGRPARGRARGGRHRAREDRGRRARRASWSRPAGSFGSATGWRSAPPATTRRGGCWWRSATAAGSITLARFRDLLGTSRKPAQLLLERFDADGLTRRVGDERVLRRKARTG